MAAGAHSALGSGPSSPGLQLPRVAMQELAVVAAMAFMGYWDAPAWSVPAGAAVLTAAAWWRKLQLLRRHPQVPLSTKMTTYLVVSIAINVGLAAAGLVAGRLAAWWLLG